MATQADVEDKIHELALLATEKLKGNVESGISGKGVEFRVSLQVIDRWLAMCGNLKELAPPQS